MDTTRCTDTHWYDRRLRGDDADGAAASTAQENNNNNNNDDEDDELDSSFPLPDLHGISDILTPMHIRELSNHMPARAEGYAWTLAFTTTTMGFSLKSLYRSLSRYEGPVLLIIRDNQQMVFGAFSSCTLNPSESFYGTGETYLFTFKHAAPKQQISTASSSSSSAAAGTQLFNSGGGSSASTISKSNQASSSSSKSANSGILNNSNTRFRRYPWTGDNLYFIKGNSDSLAFGAGEGNFGLWLDEDLYHGSTHSCKTFNNEPLTFHEDFVVCTLECWVFL